jgi:hypothetical protein
VTAEQERMAGRFKATTEAWDEEIDGTLLSGSQAAGAVVHDAHEAWDETAATSADALFEAVTDAASAAEEAVAATGDALDAGTGALLDGPGDATTDELLAVQAVLGMAEPLTAGLDALLPDLGITLRVVAQVDRLLEGMA